MKTSIDILEDIRQSILSLGKTLEEAEAIGICGSLARGNFHEKSDIDIFIILKTKGPGVNPYIYWWNIFHDILGKFHRDISIFIYSVDSLKNISNWYVLRLVSEGIILFDKGEVKNLFQKIQNTALDAGLVEVIDKEHRYWTFKDLKLGEEREIKVNE